MNQIYFFLILVIYFPFFTYAKNNPECYSYLTEIVRSSNFPFQDWKISPQKANLIIDTETNDFTSARVAFDTNGTGTLGWIKYEYKNNILYNTSADLDSPQVLVFNNNLLLPFHACLTSGSIYKITQNKKVYFYQKEKNIFTKTNIFIIHGDYVYRIKEENNYSLVEYENNLGEKIRGWVLNTNLTKVNFDDIW